MSDTMASAAGQIGQSTGLTNIGQGVADLFGGGGQAPAEGQPGGPALVGPPSPVASPNFLQGFAQGFMGMQPGQGADAPMGAGGELGGGIGQLVHAINQLRNPQGMIAKGVTDLFGGNSPGQSTPQRQSPIVSLAPPVAAPSVDVAQNPYVQTQSKPGLIDGIIKGLTYGIISSGGSAG